MKQSGHTLNMDSSGYSQVFDAAAHEDVSIYLQGDDTKTFSVQGTLNGKDWSTISSGSLTSFSVESQPRVFNIVNYRLIRISGSALSNTIAFILFLNR